MTHSERLPDFSLLLIALLLTNAAATAGAEEISPNDRSVEITGFRAPRSVIPVKSQKDERACRVMPVQRNKKERKQEKPVSVRVSCDPGRKSPSDFEGLDEHRIHASRFPDEGRKNKLLLEIANEQFVAPEYFFRFKRKKVSPPPCSAFDASEKAMAATQGSDAINCIETE
ncbi:MAG: hypothetical protein GY946_34170 [bacterium]|nr:hypothetical protein [bacterium]